jgi:hypothetical protein
MVCRVASLNVTLDFHFYFLSQNLYEKYMYMYQLHIGLSARKSAGLVEFAVESGTYYDFTPHIHYKITEKGLGKIDNKSTCTIPGLLHVKLSYIHQDFIET